MGCGDSVGVVETLSFLVTSIVVDGTALCTASLAPCIAAGSVSSLGGSCSLTSVVVLEPFPSSVRRSFLESGHSPGSSLCSSLSSYMR